MVKKKLPIGIDDFKEIIENDYYFVDKSMLINELLDKKSKVTLLPRPRRFGKTLNMSMLSYFFNIENKEENKELFKELVITKTDKMKYQGEYPVIYISLKDIKVNNWKECIEEIKKVLKKVFKTKKYIREKLAESEKIDFDEIEFLNEKGDYVGALSNLSEYLYKFHGKKVIILIDEYDTPLVTAQSQGYYEEAIFFFRNFLSAGLKGNPYLEFAVLTGILRINNGSIFSGLNNLSVSTILDDEYDHFGLKEKEVENMLEYYELNYKLEEVKKWYNGYRFGEGLVYNPWSLINFVSKKKLGAYWINTSDNVLIKQLLDKNDINIFEKLELIFQGEDIQETISENIIFDNLDNINTIWSLMLFSGYLTFDKFKISEITGIKSYFLKIPNQEVKSFFRESFIELYAKGDVYFYGTMMENLFLGDIESFIIKFKRLFISALSYHDTTNNEKYYHHFMLGLLLTLGDKYIVTSNRESGYGRYDIALEPKDKKNYGLIFEFKVSETKEALLGKAQEALAQIEEKKYDIDMKNNGVIKIIKIGMAFSGKNVEIVSIIEK